MLSALPPDVSTRSGAIFYNQNQQKVAAVFVKNIENKKYVVKLLTNMV